MVIKSCEAIINLTLEINHIFAATVKRAMHRNTNLYIFKELILVRNHINDIIVTSLHIKSTSKVIIKLKLERNHINEGNVTRIFK